MTIIGIIAFLIGWIYAIAAFGFFLGLGLGWLPAIVIAWMIDAVAVATLALIGIVIERKRFAELTPKRLTKRSDRRSTPPKPDSQDYLDWANREGKWRDDVDDLPIPSRGSHAYLEWANREGHWAER